MSWLQWSQLHLGVVWLGGMLPDRVLANAQAAAEACDVLLVVGSAGVV